MRSDSARPKPLQANTPLLRSDRAEAVVVTGDGDNEAHLAGGACSEFLAQVLGRALPVLTESEYRTARRYRSRHVVAVGRPESHRIIRELGLNQRHYCGAHFPGAQGFVLRTISRAFGDRRNVVLLNATDREGWDSVCEAFCDLLTYVDKRATIPPTNFVQSPLRPEPWEPERLEDYLRERPIPTCEGLLQCALEYDTAGCMTRGIVLRNWLRALVDLSDEGRLPAPFDRTELWLSPFLRLWRNLGVRPVFDDELRGQVSEMCLREGRRLADRLAGHSAPGAEHLGPADILAVASVGGVGAHFEARHELREAGEWRSRAVAALAAAQALPLLPAEQRIQSSALRELLELSMGASNHKPERSWIYAARRLVTVMRPGEGSPPSTPEDRWHRVTLTRLAALTTQLASTIDEPVQRDLVTELRDHAAPGTSPVLTDVDIDTRQTAVIPAFAGGGAPGPPQGDEFAEVSSDPLSELLHVGVGLRPVAGDTTEYMQLGGCSAGAERARLQAVTLLDDHDATFIAGRATEGSSHVAGAEILVDGSPVEHRFSAVTGILHAGRIRVVSMRTLDPHLPTWRRTVLHVPERGYVLIDEVSGKSQPPVECRLSFPVSGAARATDDGVSVAQGASVLRLSALTDGGFLVGAEGDAHTTVHLTASTDNNDNPHICIATELAVCDSDAPPPIVRGGTPPGPILCTLASERSIHAGTSWAGMADLAEVEADAYTIGAFLAFAGLRRFAVGDTYIETTSPCTVIMDPAGQSATISSLAAGEAYYSSSAGSDSAVMQAEAMLTVQFALPPGLVEELQKRAHELAPRERSS